MLTGCDETIEAGWWRDPEALQREAAAHGSLEAAANHHGCCKTTLAKWWRKHQLPPHRRIRPKGQVAIRAGEPVSDAEILAARVKELEQAVVKERSADVATERVLQRIEAALPVLQPRYRTLPKRSKIARGESHEFALLISDLHAGEVVDREATLGLNEYNWTVMMRRLARVQDSVFSFAEHRPYPISRLNIWLLGDLLSGDAHDELTTTNEMPTAEAAVQLAYDLSDWMLEFREAFPEIKVAGVPGNHPRTTRKPSNKMPHSNSDWLCMKMMEMRLANQSGFEFDFPRSTFAVTTVADAWRVLLLHGDGIKGGGVGAPFGGVVRRATTLQQQFQQANKPFDFVVCGHFHQPNTIAGIGARTIMNGSVKGVDEFSLKQFGSGHAPSQMLLTFHRDRGLTDQSWLDLESVEPAALRAVTAAAVA